MKAVLMSIRPTWAQAIDRGDKNVEVRKSCPTRRKLMELGVTFRVYLYCSKGKDSLITILRDGDENYGTIYHGKPVFITSPEGGYGSRIERGTVFGECDCVCIERLNDLFVDDNTYHYPHFGESCLTMEQIERYGKGKSLYGWRLGNYKFYNDPKTLADFGLKRPPQSWCYVDER